MAFTKRLVGFSISNIIIFYIAFLIAPSFVVFGNLVTSPIFAIALNGIIIGIVATLVEPIVKDFKLKLTDQNWIILYYVVNTIAIYLLARTSISKNVGIGLSAFWVAIILGFFVNLAQYGVFQMIEGKKVESNN